MARSTSNAISQEAFTNRRNVEAKATLAANAGSSEIASVKVPVNCTAVVRGIVRAAAGVVGASIAVTADAGTDLLTATDHGVATGTPVIVGGTAVPTGTTAGVIYFANAASANTIKLYDTSANAVAGGATGLVDLTSTGTAVTLTPTVITAVYQVFGAVVNRLGHAVLLGTPVVDSLEHVAGWACTVAVDNTNDTIQVMVTPDVDLATRVAAELEVLESSADIVV